MIGSLDPPLLAQVFDCFLRITQRVAPIVGDIRAAGIDTASGLARELNERDIEAPRGGQWGATQVRRLLGRID